MSTIPKFQACGQDWNAMEQSLGGRLCGDCKKVVMDMRRKRWHEIEKLHRDEPGVCGLYSQKQVEHWGHEIPRRGFDCSRALQLTTLMLTLAGITPVAHAQSQEGKIELHCEQAKPVTIDSTGQTIIRGRIMDGTDNSKVSYVGVRLSKATRTNADDDGFYRLDVSAFTEMFPLVLSVAYPGYETYEVLIDKSMIGKTSELNIYLTRSLSKLIVVSAHSKGLIDPGVVPTAVKPKPRRWFHWRRK